MIRHSITDAAANRFLFLSLLALGINFVSQTLAFPLQVVLIIYGVTKADVRLLPGLYILLLDAAYFKFTGKPGIMKFRLVIGISVLNAFVFAVFFKTLYDFAKQRFDRGSASFLPFWASMAVPAVVIALMGRADGVLSNWQTPFIYFMIPAQYFWGMQLGRSWYEGRDYVVKKFILIFVAQLTLEFIGQYSPGCQFQNHIIPIAFGTVLLMTATNSNWKLMGIIGIVLGIASMLFGRYFETKEMYGVEGSAAAVSTFTRLFVVLIGVFIIVTAGKQIKGHALRVLPWIMLICSAVVFCYAVGRAGTKNQAQVVTAHLDSADESNIMARFEMKLVGDRGAVWYNAVHDELFRPPHIFKRQKDFEYYDPRHGRAVTKMAPHNQFLTLVCRQGWWLGFGMFLFLVWMHVREFNAASRIDKDRYTLIALLAPSAAIFVAVGLTGQHVFTQMWHASSMAGLTFSGILYGAVVLGRMNLPNRRWR